MIGMCDAMEEMMSVYIYDEHVELATDGDGQQATVSDAAFGISGTETAPSTEIEATPSTATETKRTQGQGKLATVFGILSAVLFVACVILAYMLVRLQKKQAENKTDKMDVETLPEQTVLVEHTAVEPEAVNAENRVGKLHNIGRRSGQQDSLGMTDFAGGTLAIVADGMGGLADGDRVSQQIVMTMLQDSTMLKPGKTENCLYEMIAHANHEVNQMLGVENQYKSGSTVIAALIEKDGFQWATVGDSHIYLYRGNQLLLLNREHIYETELMQKAVNGRITFQSVKTDKSRSGLTSFIGMGELKYIDGSTKKLSYQTGDWLLLMSDGVFNTLSEPEICRIVQESVCASEAAARMEQAVLAKQNPKQDNFTAILLEL